MSPWSTSRAIPSPGSSPCPRPRPSTAPSTTGSGGASRPCSPTSRRAASAWRTATSAAPSAWAASSSSWPWPCSGRSRPGCGTRSTTRRRTKKSPGSATPQPSPRPDLPLQARHPPPPGLPATARRPAAVVGRVAELMGGKALLPQLEPDGGRPEAAEELVEEGGGEQVAEAGRERVAGEDGAQRTERDGDAEAVAGVAVEGAVDRVGRQAVEEARVEPQAAVALLAHAGELEQPPPVGEPGPRREVEDAGLTGGKAALPRLE